jgi:general secretion pathway protein D
MEPIVEFERDVTHRGMINEVNTKWRPVYAVNAPDLNDTDVATTKQILANENDESSIEQEIEQRMHKIKIPSVSFRPPATIQDAIDFFRRASKDYDDPQRPVDERGFNFVLAPNKPMYGAGATAAAPAANANDDPFAVTETPPAGAAAATDSQLPQIPVFTASNITIYEALKIVCQQTGFKFKIRGSVVMVMPKDATDDVLVTRSYNVLDMFADRVTSAAEDVRANSNSPFGEGGDALVADGGNASGGSQERAWKEFFTQMGVLWPPKASINYIKTIGKLRVTNTAENLAVFERALNDLNVTPTLIEIETRFVEVSQDDLNSLGFEWILNSDYSLNVGGKLGKILGLHDGNWLSSEGASAGGTDNGGATVTPSTSTSPSSNSEAIQQATATAAWVRGRYYNPYTNTYSNQPGTWISNPDGTTVWQPNVKTAKKNLGIARMGGNATYTTGQRYLSQDSNHVSGGDSSTNDQFTRLNAFLGDMNLSMILHMLSQRSDTDMLSAPKVVTKSGQDATIKVVTEYIYPTDYDVTIQSSGGSSSAWGSSRGNILAMVEPQNFKKREVGVILEVRPEVTAEGQMINLDLNPKVVGEPTWHDYGMKVPIQKDASTLPNLVGLSDDVVNQILSNNSNEQEYYTVPMEQPFFPVRSIDTHISIYNGATLVMGGLITEERRSIDDKIPFLGDLPFIGRLFRSHAESTKKRNLLIFVTARLIDPRGRQVKTGSRAQSDSSHPAGARVTPAPVDGVGAKK